VDFDPEILLQENRPTEEVPQSRVQVVNTHQHPILGPILEGIA
jgi:hypothetical protein